jgi:flagellar hook protein FlgE
MLDSIFIGMTGLQGYSQGLRVIANNTANLNTPGYKGSTLQFADMFYSSSGGNSGPGGMQVGYGLNTAGTVLNFAQGELQQTGNAMDLAINGQGLFTLKDGNGAVHYTRAGQFTFDAQGTLVSRIDGSKVMGIDSNGQLAPISIENQQSVAGKATTRLKFDGNLSSAGTTQTLGSVPVTDSLGQQHSLTVTLTNDSANTPGGWAVEVLDGATVVGSGEIVFSGGVPDPAHATVDITYTPAQGSAMPLTLDFSSNVTSFASGSLSSLAFASQDGWGPGALTGVSFDAAGTVVMAYPNGQTVKGAQLALGRFDSLEGVTPLGNNEFDATNPLAWHTGVARSAGFGAVQSGAIEMSNVDLSREFSALVIMQRGYQASSQVISTANDMLEQLFQMKQK